MLKAVSFILLALFVAVSPSVFAMNRTAGEDLADNNPTKRQKMTPSKGFESLLTTKEEAYNQIHPALFSFLDQSHLLSLREISTGSKKIVDDLYFYPIEESPLFLCPFSSEISGFTIRHHIYRFLDMARQRIVIASDQLTDSDLVAKLKQRQNSQPNLQVDIVCGENTHMSQELRNQIQQSKIKYTEIKHKENYKMHNKFMLIDDYGVLTGSPNATTSAYERNVESFVAIRNPNISRLYSLYYDYITNARDIFDISDGKYAKIEKQMDELNTLEGCPLSVCLAPIHNIRLFVRKRIEGSMIIAINMFLMSHAKTNFKGDLINALQQQTRDKGSKAIIKIDGGMYNAAKYVKNAVHTFDNNPNADIQAVTLKNKASFHDKLVMLTKGDIHTVIIGSAGFTDNVQDNNNQENMIAITGREDIFQFFQRHFEAINRQNNKVETIQKVNK